MQKISKKKYWKNFTLLSVTGCAVVNIAMAQKNHIVELEQIRAIPESRPDVQTLSKEDIQKKPTRNGTITDLLRSNTNVVFSDTADSASGAGEIAPDRVSFHGEKFYNNNFMLDGMSNNDIMNPGGNAYDITNSVNEANPQTLRIVPGHPESFHVNANLLEELNVYDSNVPAKYGDFTGGVVEAKLKDPDTQKSSGSIGFRTTRSDWTHFIPDEEDIYGDDESADNPNQPKFTKKIYDVTLNQPLSDRSALMFSYNRTESEIPEVHPGLQDMHYKEQRRTETLMVKWLNQIDLNNKITASVMYSPHSGSYWYNNVKDGEYEIKGGGWRASLNWDSLRSWGNIKSTLSYSKNTNTIDYKGGNDLWSWNVSNDQVAEHFNWCSRPIGKVDSMKDCSWAYEGGIGHLENESKIWTLKQDYELNPLRLGNTVHHLEFGWHVDIGEAKAKRPKDTNLYTANKISNTPDCLYCLPGILYATNLAYYPAHNSKARNNSYSIYVQDRIKMGRLELTPGIRIKHDDFLKDTTFAPRLAFNFDLYGDNQTNVFGGVNRYYAGSMLSYALRSNMPKNLIYTGRKETQEWSDIIPRIASNSANWNTLELKTPYSDEINLGLSHNWNNSRWLLKWVHRKSRDQFTMQSYEDENGYDVYYMTNDGCGKSNTFSLSVSNLAPYQWGALQLGYTFGARFSKYSSNSNTYEDEALDADGFNERYLYDGKMYNNRADIPPMNFSQPWNMFLEINTDVPDWNLNWTHRLNYTAGYTSYKQTYFNRCQSSTQSAACGDYNGRVYDFVEREYKKALTLDWRINWKVPVRSNQHINLSLDVLNVFNTKVGSLAAYSQNGTNTTASGYKTGRQFWLSAAYQW
ncbi:TonB-dependent receptor plug domain-containing protein [Advenella sp. RU8]|uniref:TonB-dependent receptor plug domain-containing protein n=1 Tax=Advenella sp. RU8 TaxID=3399575 RepID=UPI003AB089ED